MRKRRVNSSPFLFKKNQKDQKWNLQQRIVDKEQV